MAATLHEPCWFLCAFMPRKRCEHVGVASRFLFFPAAYFGTGDAAWGFTKAEALPLQKVTA
jgi:hypothetical protein